MAMLAAGRSVGRWVGERRREFLFVHRKLIATLHLALMGRRGKGI